MHLIPEVKSFKKCEKFVIDGCKFIFSDNIDKRVINLSKKVNEGSTITFVKVIDESKTEYKMFLSKEKVDIIAYSQESAFYAIQTLRQIIKFGYCDVCEIVDSPDYNERGFYLDITRGRVPTLDTLKELVDNLSYYKMNMLQLYVEHTFPFKEYDGIYQRTGYITPEEIVELDKYCIENFVEFVPSLSCFGHLYELLSDERYRELCELEDYRDTTIFWCERMAHHTINPLDERSLELVKSLIDQYSPLFSSNKFNICCDETFDLGNGRNTGKDKGRLYVDFVRKIVDHVKSKGKTPMMWGDIITQHADLISEIGDGVIYLSWGYSANESPNAVNKVKEAGKTQYVCPGLSNWTSLIEMPQTSIPNISKMAKYGYDAKAEGILTTCWGDYGHISSVYACMYGTIFACAKSWNVNYNYSNFDESLDILYYGYNGASKIVKAIANAYKTCYWYELVCDYSNEKFGNTRMNAWKTAKPDELVSGYNEIEEATIELLSTNWENNKVKEILLCVAQGSQLMISMLMSRATGEKLGAVLRDVETWLTEFSKLYLKESKKGELEEFVKMFYHLGEKYIK